MANPMQAGGGKNAGDSRKGSEVFSRESFQESSVLGIDHRRNPGGA